MISFYKRTRGTTVSVAYSFCGALLMGTAGLHAGSPSAQQQPEPDLFKKDTPAFFIQAEYLCWKVNEGALDYAIKMHHPNWEQPTSSGGVADAAGHFQNAEFDWASGLRIAFGYFRAPHFWDMFLQYTYVPSFGSNEAHAPHGFNEYLNGTFAQPRIVGNEIPLKSAHSRIRLKYHILDWLASRRFFPNEHLRLNLYGGPTSAFIYQKWNVYYKDMLNGHAKVRNSWQFEGVGLKLGTKLDWYMGWDIYLTGLASSGILSGWYHNTSHERTDVPHPVFPSDPSRPIRDTHFHDKRLAYTAQFMGGFSWQKAYRSVRAEIGVGYELNIWANLHQIYRSFIQDRLEYKPTLIDDSLVSLQGFNVRANLDF